MTAILRGNAVQHLDLPFRSAARDIRDLGVTRRRNQPVLHIRPAAGDALTVSIGRGA
ncbi:hypothetical protein [Rhodopseudomonas telluris]|uniref:Uncharacterized protein n=1 Tax=Rhodopseudomonas telluris TaxID=644215 RepID=A0ABV6ERX8_9BRAD